MERIPGCVFAVIAQVPAHDAGGGGGGGGGEDAALTVTAAVAKIEPEEETREVVYEPAAEYECETVESGLQEEQTGARVRLPCDPSPNFT